MGIEAVFIVNTSGTCASEAATVGGLLTLFFPGKPRLMRFYNKTDASGKDLVRGGAGQGGAVQAGVGLTGAHKTEHAQQQILSDVHAQVVGEEKHAVLLRSTPALQVSRRPAHLCNFVEYAGCQGWGEGCRLVYRNYATLYFVFVADAGERCSVLRRPMGIF